MLKRINEIRALLDVAESTYELLTEDNDTPVIESDIEFDFELGDHQLEAQPALKQLIIKALFM